MIFYLRNFFYLKNNGNGFDINLKRAMALRTRCPPSVDNMLQGARRLCVSLTTAVHPPQSHRLRSQRRWTSDRPVARSSWDATHVADESFDESLTQFSDIHPDSAGGSLPPYYAGLNLAQPPYEESQCIACVFLSACIYF